MRFFQLAGKVTTRRKTVSERSNCLSHSLFSVVLSVPEHGIEDGEEFSGAGCEDEFEGFSGGLQSGAEGFHGGVVSAGDEGGDVERAERA